MLRPGQMETVSSPQIVFSLIGFPSHSLYSFTLRANVISTAMLPEAERDQNNLAFVTSITRSKRWQRDTGMLLPGPCALAGTCSVPAEIRAWCRTLLPPPGFCCQRPWRHPRGSQRRCATGNASQIALCLTCHCKLAMWKLKRCRA